MTLDVLSEAFIETIKERRDILRSIQETSESKGVKLKEENLSEDPHTFSAEFSSEYATGTIDVRLGKDNQTLHIGIEYEYGPEKDEVDIQTLGSEALAEFLELNKERLQGLEELVAQHEKIRTAVDEVRGNYKLKLEEGEELQPLKNYKNKVTAQLQEIEKAEAEIKKSKARQELGNVYAAFNELNAELHHVRRFEIDEEHPLRADKSYYNIKYVGENNLGDIIYAVHIDPDTRRITLSIEEGEFNIEMFPVKDLQNLAFCLEREIEFAQNLTNQLINYAADFGYMFRGPFAYKHSEKQLEFEFIKERAELVNEFDAYMKGRANDDRFNKKKDKDKKGAAPTKLLDPSDIPF